MIKTLRLFAMKGIISAMKGIISFLGCLMLTFGSATAVVAGDDGCYLNSNEVTEELTQNLSDSILNTMRLLGPMDFKLAQNVWTQKKKDFTLTVTPFAELPDEPFLNSAQVLLLYVRSKGSPLNGPLVAEVTGEVPPYPGMETSATVTMRSLKDGSVVGVFDGLISKDPSGVQQKECSTSGGVALDENGNTYYNLVAVCGDTVIKIRLECEQITAC